MHAWSGSLSATTIHHTIRFSEWLKQEKRLADSIIRRRCKCISLLQRNAVHALFMIISILCKTPIMTVEAGANQIINLSFACTGF
ncbi:MAG: hypothetical protein V3S97_06535 [Candidatus Bathyarchaeia archaeon]